MSSMRLCGLFLDTKNMHYAVEWQPVQGVFTAFAPCALEMTPADPHNTSYLEIMSQI